jgi:hypothetical protein
VQERESGGGLIGKPDILEEIEVGATFLIAVTNEEKGGKREREKAMRPPKPRVSSVHPRIPATLI